MSPERDHQPLREELQGIRASVAEIHERLFVDNGRTSMQTRLDRIERIAAVLTWAGASLGAAMLSAVGAFIVNRIVGA